MAMKVLPLQPNDHRSIRRVADELRIFEGIDHPNLVKCYGVEIHNVGTLFALSLMMMRMTLICLMLLVEMLVMSINYMMTLFIVLWSLIIMMRFMVLQDEMLMFMEYCDEGTLESLAISTETGLPEELVRKYTRQLLEAVHTLHERGIVHRDIKGGMACLAGFPNQTVTVQVLKFILVCISIIFFFII